MAEATTTEFLGKTYTVRMNPRICLGCQVEYEGPTGFCTDYCEKVFFRGYNLGLRILDDTRSALKRKPK